LHSFDKINSNTQKSAFATIVTKKYIFRKNILNLLKI